MGDDTERTEWTCQECGHVEWRKRCSHCWRPEDPTEDEIAERAAEIRKGWDESQRAKRLGVVVEHWTPPESQRVGGRVYRKQTRFDV